MLYSPILSISRLIVMIPWILFISSIHLMFSLVSKRFFFYFFRIFFKGLVSIIGIKIKISGVPQKRNTLFVSNHISYLDIIVYGSLINTVFVAKSEIKKWPLINKLCVMAKTIFVERNDIKFIRDQIKLINETLLNDTSVLLFPEGTSSDGTNVLKFKSSLFSIVDYNELKECYIQPVSISYNKLDGLPLNKFYKPYLAWFGGMDLFSHVWKFLGLGVSEVNVHFHKAKKFSSFLNRKDACSFCYDKIAEQISKDSYSSEINNKLKLYDFKFL